MDRLTRVLMKHWGWISYHWFMLETKQWGWDLGHQPLNHTEDPQDHILKSPELGSHKGTTHHPRLAWQGIKFPNQQGSAYTFSPLKMYIEILLGPGTKPSPARASRCSVIYMPRALHRLSYTLLFPGSGCDRHGNWSLSGEYMDYT